MKGSFLCHHKLSYLSQKIAKDWNINQFLFQGRGKYLKKKNKYLIKKRGGENIPKDTPPCPHFSFPTIYILFKNSF